MAADALFRFPLHMAVHALLLETSLVLMVHLQAIGIAGIVVQHLIVMTVPAGISGETGRRVAGNRVMPCIRCTRIAAMAGGLPLLLVYLCSLPVESREIVHIRPGCPVATKTCDRTVDRPPPDRIGTSGSMTAGACPGAGLGIAVIAGPLLLEGNIFPLVYMECPVKVRNLSHATGHIPMAGTCAGTVHYCLGMTNVTGKTCLHMTSM